MGYMTDVETRVPERNSDSEATTEATSSNTTRAELKALSVFRNINNPYAPHLVDYKEAVQGPHGPLPGGYLTFTVMTKMPGDSLHNLYFWGMTDDERKEITERFLIALRCVPKYLQPWNMTPDSEVKIDLLLGHRTSRLCPTQCPLGR